jgi:hypothetical protein
VGAAAKIEEATLLIGRDDVVGRQPRDQLDLVGVLGEYLERLVAADHLADERLGPFLVAAHPPLDLHEVVRGQRPRQVEIVVEAMLDRRADPKSSLRKHLLDRLRHQVGAGVAHPSQLVGVSVDRLDGDVHPRDLVTDRFRCHREPPPRHSRRDAKTPASSRERDAGPAWFHPSSGAPGAPLVAACNGTPRGRLPGLTPRPDRNPARRWCSLSSAPRVPPTVRDASLAVPRKLLVLVFAARTSIGGRGAACQSRGGG